MDDDALEEWEQRLRLAEADLAERERAALAEDARPEELVALAAERDELAEDRDTIADRWDERSRGRDDVSLRRDVAGSERDRAARALDDDLDVGFADRSSSGADRDFAAGDRADSYDDRHRSSDARHRASDDRDRARNDRDANAQRAADQDHEISTLRAALETRELIGQAAGVLMARHRMSSDRAFATMVRLSQHHNLRVREIASKIVAAVAPDGEPPAAEGGAPGAPAPRSRASDVPWSRATNGRAP